LTPFGGQGIYEEIIFLQRHIQRMLIKGGNLTGLCQIMMKIKATKEKLHVKLMICQVFIAHKLVTK